MKIIWAFIWLVFYFCFQNIDFSVEDDMDTMVFEMTTLPISRVSLAIFGPQKKNAQYAHALLRNALA